MKGYKKVKTQKSVLVTYAPGTICLRCGADKGTEFSCSVWGTDYKRHMWNKEPVKIPTFTVTYYKSKFCPKHS